LIRKASKWLEWLPKIKQGPVCGMFSGFTITGLNSQFVTGMIVFRSTGKEKSE
jgi:hypothetical protein